MRSCSFQEKTKWKKSAARQKNSTNWNFIIWQQQEYGTPNVDVRTKAGDSYLFESQVPFFNCNPKHFFWVILLQWRNHFDFKSKLSSIEWHFFVCWRNFNHQLLTWKVSKNQENCRMELSNALVYNKLCFW